MKLFLTASLLLYSLNSNADSKLIKLGDGNSTLKKENCSAYNYYAKSMYDNFKVILSVSDSVSCADTVKSSEALFSLLKSNNYLYRYLPYHSLKIFIGGNLVLSENNTYKFVQKNILPSKNYSAKNIFTKNSIILSNQKDFLNFQADIFTLPKYGTNEAKAIEQEVRNLKLSIYGLASEIKYMTGITVQIQAIGEEYGVRALQNQLLNLIVVKDRILRREIISDKVTVTDKYVVVDVITNPIFINSTKTARQSADEIVQCIARANKDNSIRTAKDIENTGCIIISL